MNSTQRWLVVGTLIVIGIVLPFVMLDWGYVLAGQRTPILTFYSELQPPGSFFKSPIPVGIFTSHGVAGIVLGIVAPLCLFAAAAYVVLGKQRR